jgi:hypothetical protein
MIEANEIGNDVIVEGDIDGADNSFVGVVETGMAAIWIGLRFLSTLVAVERVPVSKRVSLRRTVM